VESVAWVAERKDVLSGVFFMLTLLAYVHYARAPSTWRYLTVAFVFALGLMSKLMLVTVPFVLLLLDYWPLGRITDQRSHRGHQFLSLLVEKNSTHRTFCRFKRCHISGPTRSNRLD